MREAILSSEYFYGAISCLAPKRHLRRFVDSSSHSFTAVFRMNRPSQGNVFLHSVGNMYGTNAALVHSNAAGNM